MLLLFCNHSHLFNLVFILILLCIHLVSFSVILKNASVSSLVWICWWQILWFLFLWKHIFLPSKDICVKYRILGWQFYFLLILWGYFSTILWLSLLWLKMSTIILFLLHCKGWIFFSVILGVFPVLLWGFPDYFIMIISSFTMRCLGYVYLCVSPNVFYVYCTSGLQWFLKSWLDIAFFSFRNSSAIISSNIASSLFSLSSLFGTPIIYRFDLFPITPHLVFFFTDLFFSSILFLYYFLFSSSYFIWTYLLIC